MINAFYDLINGVAIWTEIRKCFIELIKHKAV